MENALSRFNEHITHAEVHLSDENSDKKGGHDDIRYMLEARLEGRSAVAVTHQATTLDEAVDGTLDKLANLIESTLGRLHDQELREPIRVYLNQNSQSRYERRPEFILTLEHPTSLKSPHSSMNSIAALIGNGHKTVAKRLPTFGNPRAGFSNTVGNGYDMARNGSRLIDLSLF